MYLSRYFVLAATVFAVVGCSSQPVIPRGAVQGQVTLAGQPLTSGRVLFIPVAPTTGPTVAATIVNGRYELPPEAGPVAGQQRVEVEAERNLGFAIDDEVAFAQLGGQPLPPNPVPPEFNRDSKLATTINADAPNTFDITIPTARRW